MLHERVAERWRRLTAVMTMPIPDALKVLGFPPNAEPTDQEVHHHQRQKAVEVHPDRGGDPVALIEVNNAADALKQYNERKENAGGGAYKDPGGYGGYTPPTPRPKPPPQRITWEEAEAEAGGVPSGVNWKFKTQNAYGGYGDTSATGFVAVGQMSDDKWIYVAVEHYTSRNAFTGEDVDEYWMKSQTYTGSLRDVAPKAIRALFKFPHVSKQFNAKIELFPEGMVFSKKMTLMMSARAVSFKDGMELLGGEALGVPSPSAPRRTDLRATFRKLPNGDWGLWVSGGGAQPGDRVEATTKGGRAQTMTLGEMVSGPNAMGESLWTIAAAGSRKLQVTMVLTRDRTGDEAKDAIEIVINGREFKLRDESVEFLKTKTKALSAVFGTYYYFSGDKKMLTKAKNGKTVLEFLAEKLVHEPQQLRDALKAAAEQM